MNEIPVSRETVPSAAHAVAGGRTGLLLDFSAILATDGVTRGLIGPREVPRLWERHLLNCAVVAEAAPAGADVADVGSGAGLPGVVWAICRADLRITLIEPLLRRVAFLHDVIERLQLGNVEVVRARAEELHGKRRFAVVTARAVAPLDRLAGWCLPLVRVGGCMVAMKGAAAEAEMQVARAQIVRLGGGPPALVEHGRGISEPTAWAVHIERTHPSATTEAAAPASRSARRRQPPLRRTTQP